MAPTREVLHRDESEIKDQLLALSVLASRAVDDALQCVARQDLERANRIADGDKAINQRRETLEETCLMALATQQPVASDLRAIVAAMQIAVDLERVADHGADIARIVAQMGAAGPSAVTTMLAEMGRHAQHMLAEAVDAYLRQDVDFARQLAPADDTVDDLHNQLSNRVIQLMDEREVSARLGSCLIWIAHHIERVADRATNIGEQVIFMVRGRREVLNA